MEKGKHIGARSILDDTNLLHCLYAAKLQSEQEYRKGSRNLSSQCHLPLDMVTLVHAKNAQNLVSDQDYRKRLHAYTVLPEDLRMKWAKQVHLLQSEVKIKEPPTRLWLLTWLVNQGNQYIAAITLKIQSHYLKMYLVAKVGILLRDQTIGHYYT